MSKVALNGLYGSGKFQTVDRRDVPLAKERSWVLSEKGYAVSDGKRFHKIILPCPKHQTVDHIDRNRLNNTRGNLRCRTVTEQNQNRRRFKNNTTGLIGVTAKGKSFVASAGSVHLGTFHSAAKAGQARMIS